MLWGQRITVDVGERIKVPNNILFYVTRSLE